MLELLYPSIWLKGVGGREWELNYLINYNYMNLYNSEANTFNIDNDLKVYNYYFDNEIDYIPFKCKNPFTKDRRPSFSLYKYTDDNDISKIKWNAFNESKKGDCLDFIIRKEGVSFGLAIRRYKELIKSQSSVNIKILGTDLPDFQAPHPNPISLLYREFTDTDYKIWFNESGLEKQDIEWMDVKALRIAYKNNLPWVYPDKIPIYVYHFYNVDIPFDQEVYAWQLYNLQSKSNLSEVQWKFYSQPAGPRSIGSYNRLKYDSDNLFVYSSRKDSAVSRKYVFDYKYDHLSLQRENDLFYFISKLPNLKKKYKNITYISDKDMNEQQTGQIVANRLGKEGVKTIIPDYPIGTDITKTYLGGKINELKEIIYKQLTL